MMWVIAGHNFVAVEQVPIVNYAEVKEVPQKKKFSNNYLRQFADNVRVQYASAAPIAVDTFFFLSGFLLSFSYLKRMAKIGPPMQQLLKVPMMIIHRYLR